VNHWDEHAACKGEKAEVFFGPNGNNPHADARKFLADELAVARAKRICASCIVRPSCRDDALAHTRAFLLAGRPQDDFGIFGGMTPDERIDRVANVHASFAGGELSRYSGTDATKEDECPPQP
jgi:hypothetical protein